MAKFAGSLARYPARAMFIWYTGLILAGGTLLTVPICRTTGVKAISPLDAVFTATSAACVTGLAVRSTAHDFSFVGQCVLLALMQLGGIGIITVTTFVTLSVTGRENLRQKATMHETLGANPREDLRRLIGHVVVLVLLVESVGFTLLVLRLLFVLPFPVSIWNAVFLTISAFNNAGFALADDSLVAYQNDWIVNSTIMLLIIIGGIGFPVMLDVKDQWQYPWRQGWERLHLHTKMVLIGTAGLLLFGTVVILVLEWDNALEGMSIPRRLLVALFQSTTTRTAGFNTIDLNSLTNATIFIMVVLMMIGASPCSTGGGFKVSTLMILAVHSVCRLRGSSRIHIFRRTIPAELVDRASSYALLFTVTGAAGLALLLVAEQSIASHDATQGTFLKALFEVCSALGTVGLSLGITPDLTALGKCLIILMMFIGRLGPITLLLALTRERSEKRYEYPKEEVLIG